MQFQFQFRPVASIAERSEFADLQSRVFPAIAQVPIPLQGLSGERLSILAYASEESSPVGCLTVVDTSEDLLSRRLYGVPDSAGSSAFYGDLAVLREYRGLSIPVRLLFEAQRLFVRPRGIQSTWLLYPEGRLDSSRLRRILGYEVLPRVIQMNGLRAGVLYRREPSASEQDLSTCRLLQASEFARWSSARN